MDIILSIERLPSVARFNALDRIVLFAHFREKRSELGAFGIAFIGEFDELQTLGEFRGL